MNDIDEECIKTIRFLSVDGVEKAKSGHPGLPLGAAPMAYVLWDRFLKHNPHNPRWFNRDRFILSAGHGSMLLYSLLHLYGYPMPLDELKRFRQWGSMTPGHPEYNPDVGIECTTGPLGQGFAMGVGMAIAEKFLSNCFNLPDHPVVDHFVYAIVSDGDLMEGVSSEAASLAGYLRLGKLIYLYDDNDISIEGDTDITFTEDVRRRFQAYGWHVQEVPDGNDIEAIDRAVRKAQKEDQRPSLIIVRTHIGYGSPKQDSASAHGEPLGPEALKATKEKLGWPLEPLFYIPKKALAHFRLALGKGMGHENEWNQLLSDYTKSNPDLAKELDRVMKAELPADLEDSLPDFDGSSEPIATRSASGKVLNALARKLPHYLTGGSGDLSPSTKTILTGYGDLGYAKACASNLHFGVREHAMGAAVNGMALHGGIIPYGATFLIFSDYMRPALRIAALMKVRSIFVFTHDSIGLGEDGPTHQPIEHLMSLRAMPNMTVFRPADAKETAAGWIAALRNKGPTCISLTRQKLPILSLQQVEVMKGALKGAYTAHEPLGHAPQLIIIATGSEVSLSLRAAQSLEKEGIYVRVVSMPCWELFEEQNEGYKNKVLPPELPRISVEAGARIGWCRYTGSEERVIGLDRFGASAPGDIAMDKLGFNVENIIDKVHKVLRGEI